MIDLKFEIYIGQFSIIHSSLRRNFLSPRVL